MDLSQLKLSIEQVNNYHSQLIVVTGKSASELLEFAVSTDNLLSINLNQELSTKLIEIPRQERAKSASIMFTDLLQSLLMEQQIRVLLLNHIEILFDKTHSIDPLKLLKSNAKNFTLVVAWPGDKNNSSLTYAVPSHPEYRTYKASEFRETIFVEADQNC